MAFRFQNPSLRAFLMDGLEGSQQSLLVRASRFEFDDLGVGKKVRQSPQVMVILIVNMMINQLIMIPQVMVIRK